MNNDLQLPIQPLMSQLTMNVTLSGVRVWRFRLAVGTWLIWLAAHVMGTGIQIDMEKEDARR